MRSIAKLRNRVAGIDSGIIRLIARRFAVTRRIGQAKKRFNIPLRNWQVEKSVIKHARAAAAARRVPEEMITRIMQLLISESRSQQEKNFYSAYGGTRERVLVIGGLGSMGTWLCHFLTNQGHNVMVYDPRGRSRTFANRRDIRSGLRDADVAVIAAPIEAVPQVLDRIAEHGFRGLTFDIASLKGHLRRSIDRALRAGVPVASVHPLFGPRTTILSDKAICICDCGDASAAGRAEGFFKDSAATIVRMPLAEHDRAMAYVLGLSHLVNVLFAQVLCQSGFDYPSLKKTASTTFISQVATAASVVFEDPRLYHAIQKHNPFREKVLSDLRRSVKTVSVAVRAGDAAQFTGIMNKSRRWLAAGRSVP